MILESERLILRLWEKDDANALYELARDEKCGFKFAFLDEAKSLVVNCVTRSMWE